MTNPQLHDLRLHIATAMEAGVWRDGEDAHFRRWFDGHNDQRSYEGLQPPQNVPERLRKALRLLSSVDIGFAHQLGNALRLRLVYPADFLGSSVNVVLDIMEELGWEYAEETLGVEHWLGYNMRSGRPLHVHAYMPLSTHAAYGAHASEGAALTLTPAA